MSVIGNQLKNARPVFDLESIRASWRASESRLTTWRGIPKGERCDPRTFFNGTDGLAAHIHCGHLIAEVDRLRGELALRTNRAIVNPSPELMRQMADECYGPTNAGITPEKEQP